MIEGEVLTGYPQKSAQLLAHNGDVLSLSWRDMILPLFLYEFLTATVNSTSGQCSRGGSF
ncbi:hypothetical protein SAMN05216599_104336 [Pseudomonas cichorii]|nr:hypothetical protein SAMN05216599_104336 [Pseudomonas cichorii]